jgi:hypothetical protein
MEESLVETRKLVKTLGNAIGGVPGVGQAFVTFHKQTDTSSVIEAFTMSSLKSSMSRLFFCCYASTGYFEDRPIKVLGAPEPNDIIWENLQVGFGVRNRARIVTWLATGVLIFINLLVLFYLKGAQTQIYDDYQSINSSDRDEDDLAKVESLSILISLAIIVANRLIVVTVRKLSL